MKISYVGLTAMICFLAQFQPANAQQSNLEITFELASASQQKSGKYAVRGMSYSCATVPQDSSYHSYEPYSVNLELVKNLDEFLLQWVAGKVPDAKGTVTVKNNDIGKVVRTIAFEEGKTANASESFSSDGNYGYVSSSLSLYVKRLVVDNVAVSAP